MKQQEQLKNNFKSLRVRAGLNQEQVANELHIARSSFVDYENNPNNIKLSLLLKLVMLYGCKFNDFFIGIRES